MGVSFVADSALLIDDSNPQTDPNGYRAAVFNFSGQEVGMADIHLGVAHQHLAGRVRLALALELLKVGQFITRHVLVYASVELALTVFEGESIGTSATALDPSQPARRFMVNNVSFVPLSLDRDQLTVGGGAILHILDREWVLRVAHTPWGKKTAALTSFNLGVLLPFG
jgi:hypothetical protein